MTYGVHYTILHVYTILYHTIYVYTGYSYIFLHGMGEIKGAVEGYGDSALKEVAHVVSIYTILLCVLIR